MMRIGVGASMIRENKVDRDTCDIIKRDINDKLQNYLKIKISIMLASPRNCYKISSSLFKKFFITKNIYR